MAHNTIRDYLRRIKQHHLTAAQLLLLDDESLSTFLYREEIPELQGNERYQLIEKQLPLFVEDFRKRGVTRQL